MHRRRTMKMDRTVHDGPVDDTLGNDDRDIVALDHCSDKSDRA